jgi:putative transcriptional regulator
MIKEESVGQLLIDALQNALDTPGTGKILNPQFDVKALRKHLKLTQEAFSRIYHIKLRTLKNWEQGERAPDATSVAYLTCIAKKPDVINTILNT